MAQPAVTTSTLPRIKVEPDLEPPPLQPLIAALSSQEELPSSSPPPSVPPFLDSITQLRHLSDALSAFYRCYDDLQSHLNFIHSAIDSKLAAQIPNSAPIPSNPAPPKEPSPTPSSNPSAEVKSKEVENENEKEKSIKPLLLEVESLCAMMSSKGLRKYMISNIGESKKLREEVPKALKLAPNPAKLVLECSGRFFLQGIKAYTKDSPMIPAREASVLVLECFLLMGEENAEVRIEKAIKEEAAQAAMSWRKRLISEGGLAKASEIDARGLLMFLGCFGIPGIFRYDDFRDLVHAGNVKEILGVLKRSSILMAKITDVIERMAKNKMAIDAIDIAYTFGFEDKITPQTILTSFLRDAKESWKRTKRASQGSAAALNEANKKHLAALRSVIKCLESHKIDPSKLLPGWQINEKILSLEKDITDFDKNVWERTFQKRKADDTDSSRKLKNQETKRLRHTSHGSQHPQAAARVDGQRNLLHRIPGHTTSSFASPSLLHGTDASLLPESIPSLLAGSGGGVLGVGGSVSAGASVIVQTGSYAGVYGGSLVDAAGQRNYTGQPYGLHANAAFDERLVSHSYAGQPPPLGLTTLYRAPPSVEGFAGLPSSSTVGVPSRSSASDLYQFADSVVESESYQNRGHRAVGAVPHVIHHSPYLY